MHICFIGEIATAQVKTGGIGSFVANIIPELIQEGCVVSVISYKRQQAALEIEQAQGFKIYWINTHQWGPLRWLKRILDTNKLLASIQQTNPIHIVETSEAGLFLLSKFSNITYVIRLHGGHIFFANSTSDTPYSRKKAFMEKLSLKQADAIIGVSKYVLSRTAEVYPFIQKKSNAVIHNPIVTQRFYAADSQKVVRGKILFYGALTEKKGIRQLVEAMPLITAKYPQAWLHVYGRDIPVRPSGNSYKALLNESIQTLGIHNITLHDPVANHEMPAIIESAQMVVLPSHMEAMPLAWLEAMAMEKPFIASNTGPGPEIIVPGIHGLLCNPFQSESIAAQILYCFDHPEHAAEMGKNARVKILSEFGSAELAKKNIQFFNQIARQTT